MKLYTAQCAGDAKNPHYPNCVEIKTRGDFVRAVQYDHMAAQMANNYRNTDNFLGCDCVMFDVDNTHSDDPAEWITADDIAETLPVNYMLVRSRNYMRTKRKVDKRTGAVTISEAREKWHVYAPLRHPITDAGEFARLMKNILCLFPFLDPAAIDAARFFFGVPNPHVTIETGEQNIDEYIAGRAPDELREEQAQAIQEFAAKVKSGAYKDNKYTRLVVSTGCEFLGIRNPLTGDEPQAEQYDLTNLELDDNLDWISEADQRRALQWLEKWAEQYDVKLGRRYSFNNAAHPGAVAICVTCPWEHEHSGGEWPDNETVIIIEKSGKFDFLCRHSHGEALHWGDFRAYHENKNAPDQQQAQEGPTAQTPKPDNVLAYINGHMGDDIADFAREVKTGFAEFDRVAGGLYPGLYAIGAVSSLGKTTFCAQLADQIAAGGTDVLFFSMEQTRLELVTKSITRTIAKKAMNGESVHVPNSLEIRRGYMPPHVLNAAREYGESVGDRLSIVEGIFDCTIGHISQYVGAYIEANERRPVVFVDYLQVLQPTIDPQSHRQQTAKDTVDEAVKELKRLAHLKGIPVIVISSLNRANYLFPVDFESFKESGMVEYTSDCVLGLQFRCLRDPEFEKIKTLTEKRDRITREKNAKPRKLELVCLKNRYGRLYACGFDYYAEFDLFREVNTEFEAAEAVHDQIAEEATPWDEDYLSMRR